MIIIDENADPVIFTSGDDLELQSGGSDFSALAHEYYLSIKDGGIRRHFNKWIKGGSVKKAHALLHAREVEFVNYGSVALSEPIDWKIGEPGRANLSWQLHSFFFMRDLVAAHNVEGDHAYLLLIECIVGEWSNDSLSADDVAKFAWNDHSTAYRIFALSNLLFYIQNCWSDNFIFISKLVNLIARHQAVLACKKIYSVGTNHGLDQAFYLYFSTHVVGFLEFSEKVRRIALERLRFELERSFADDGVHIENSPEYHDLVLNSTVMMNQFVVDVSNVDAISNLSALGEKALRFLGYIVRPDGKWPTIGDSTEISPRSDHSTLAHLTTYPGFIYAKSMGNAGEDFPDNSCVFENSGYVVFRGAASAGYRRLHSVFKCGFLSTYHRQDDDNSIVIFADDEEWFVDGGLFRHENNDPQREYFRSVLSHNILIPEKVRVRRALPLQHNSGICVHEHTHALVSVTGTSGMYPGYVYNRTVDFDQYSEFHIKDRLTMVNHTNDATERESAFLNFLIPCDKQINFERDGVLIKSKRTGKVISMKYDATLCSEVCTLPAIGGLTQARRSRHYNVLEDVQVLRIKYEFVGMLEVAFSISCADLYRDRTI